MGFVIRALFVIGVLYLISPLRASLPDWLAKPSAASLQLAATPTVMPTAPINAAPAHASPLASGIETLSHVAVAACKGHEKACFDAATSALKSSDTGDAIAALLNETPEIAKPATNTVAVADTVSLTTAVPLPPRREAPPTLPVQKKI